MNHPGVNRPDGQDLWLAGGAGAPPEAAPEGDERSVLAGRPEGVRDASLKDGEAPPVGGEPHTGVVVPGTLLETVAAAPAGETWRTFIAVELPRPVKEAVGRLREQMPRAALLPVRWVASEAIHITLKFLGDVQPPQALEIAERLASAASRSGRLSLRPGATRAFPTLRAPRV